MNLRAVLLWLAVPLAFTLGVVFGRLLLVEKPEIAIAPRAPEPIAKKPSVPVSVPVVPQKVVGEAAKQPADTLERLKIISEMNARLTSKFTIALLMGEELNPDFVKLFGLTPADEARLKGEIAAAKLRMAQLEASHATIKPKEKGGWVVTVPPFPVEGGEVYDRFQHALHDTLGAERSAYYEQMSVSSSWDGAGLGNFGLTDSVINVKAIGEEKTTTSQWGSDQNTGVVTMRTDASVEYLKALRPELYKKLVAEGYVPDSPSGK